MLANRLWLTGSDKLLPSGAISIANFDGVYTDKIIGTNWTPSSGAVSLTTSFKKFGTGSMEITVTGNYAQSPIGTITFGSNDFTMAMWYYFASSYPNVASTGFLGGTQNYILVDSSGFKLNVTTQVGDTPASYTTAYSPQVGLNGWHYIKAGRKNNEIFIMVDGANKQTITIANNKILRNDIFRVGNIGGTDVTRFFDSVIFSLGVGDDSTYVPTAPF